MNTAQVVSKFKELFPKGVVTYHTYRQENGQEGKPVPFFQTQPGAKYTYNVSQVKVLIALTLVQRARIGRDQSR